MLKQILKFKEAILYTVIIFATFVWLLMQIIPQITELIQTEKKIKKRTVELEKVTKKLAQVREEIESTRKEEADRVKLLYKPEISFDSNESEYLVMVDDIISMVKDNGMKMYSLSYKYDLPNDEIVSQSAGKYIGCELTFALIGNYNQVKGFIMDLIKYPYLISINSIDSEPYEKDKRYLLTVAKVTLYSEK